MKLTKNQKILAGVGALAGIIFLTSSGEQEYGGGSGAFGGGFGGEGLAGLAGDAGDGGSSSPAGMTFNFPTPDTTGLTAFIGDTPQMTPDEQTMPKKATLASEFIPSPLTTEQAKRLVESSQAAAAIAEAGYGKTLFSPIKSSSGGYRVENVKIIPSGGSQAVTESLQLSKKEASAQAAAAIAESGYGKTLFSPIKSSSSSGSSVVVKKSSSTSATTTPKKTWTLAEVKAGKNRR